MQFSYIKPIYFIRYDNLSQLLSYYILLRNKKYAFIHISFNLSHQIFPKQNDLRCKFILTLYTLYQQLTHLSIFVSSNWLYDETH